MNIKNIKAALAKQAQLLGVVPVAINTTAKSTQANSVTTKSAVHSATVTDAPTIVAVSADSVSVVSKTAPVSISSDKAMPVNTSLFDTIASPTGTPNISKLPAERQEPVTIKSSIQTPTLTATDSVQPPLSIADPNKLSLQPVLIPDEPKSVRKTRKKEESPVAESIEVIVARAC